MRRLVPLALVLLVSAAAPADDPKPARPGQKPNPLDAVVGYKRHTVEGFNLLVSSDVETADVSKFERKPMEVLELELKAVSKLMTPRALDKLRTLVIWVEWDDRDSLPNGRAGSAVAVYYGGHQLSLLRKGLHPLKARSITVLSMKSLTREHQPKTDTGRCVLLHEMAHAVHDLVLPGGMSNPDVRAAYKAATERRLYDKSQYVSTNEAEFFAELTCAYFDQLPYYPRTREELKKHDPVSFKLLDKVWGAAARKPDAAALAARPKGLEATNGADKFDLTVKLADVQFGGAVRGPAFAPAELSGKVVLLGFWGGDEVAALGHLAALHEELSPYGLRVIAGPGYVTPQEKMAEELADRDVPFTGVDRMLVPVKGTNTLRSERPPHALVFDPDGSCAFRGSAYDADRHVRAAVGRSILAKLGDGELSKPLAPVAELLTGGRPLLEAVPKLIALKSSKDSETAAAAKILFDALTEPGRQAIAEARRLSKTDPVAAFLLLEPLPKRYKGTEIEGQANAQLVTVKQNGAVAAELKARGLLEKIRKLDAELSGQPGGADPSDPRFRARNAVRIGQMRKLYDELKKNHPKARATAQAERVCRPYGIG